MPTRSERLEYQEQDHDDAERGVIDGEDVACEFLHIGQQLDQAFDNIGKNGHEDGAEQGAKQRAHTADDDHRDVLDRQEQIEGFDRYETTIVGEQAASD